MWQGVGLCGRGRGMWQWVEACDKGYGHLAGEGWRHVVEAGTCGRVWGHVAGGGCENMSNVKKSKMLTMNEVLENFNLTQ